MWPARLSVKLLIICLLINCFHFLLLCVMRFSYLFNIFHTNIAVLTLFLLNILHSLFSIGSVSEAICATWDLSVVVEICCTVCCARLCYIFPYLLLSVLFFLTFSQLSISWLLLLFLLLLLFFIASHVQQLVLSLDTVVIVVVVVIIIVVVVIIVTLVVSSSILVIITVI